MSGKKTQSLAMKLIDDLLDENQEGSTSLKNKKDLDATISLEASKINIQNSAAKNKIENDDEVELPDFDPPQDDSIVTQAPHSSPVRSNLSHQERPGSTQKFVPSRPSGFQSQTENSLSTSENLRIAQDRILELEGELLRLRNDNEQLAAAGETIRRKADELLNQNQHMQSRIQRVSENKDQEIEALKLSHQSKEKELHGLKLKVEEMEMRLSTNIQKIRVRERELENRLELVKMESATVLRAKDDMILDLKRQLDQMSLEVENYRNKGQELFKQMANRQEVLRRTVKALRLALTLLESEDDEQKEK